MGYVTASLDTKKLRGSVGKGITVYTNDPVTSKVMLKVFAQVVGSVVVLPDERFVLGNVGSTRRFMERLVQKDPTEKGELEISDIRTSFPWLTATARQLTENRPGARNRPGGRVGDWILELQVEGSPGYSKQEGTVEFKTGLERQPMVSLPVRIDFRAPVNLSKRAIELQGKPAKDTVLLSVRRGLDAEQLTVEAEPESLKVKLEKSGERMFKAHVEWSGGAATEGVVTFGLDQDRIELPVRMVP